LSEREPNEVAAVLGVRSLFEPEEIDCGTWLPVELEDGGELDFCGVCSRRESEHPPIDDDEADDDEK
jgi:hypothetical protein